MSWTISEAVHAFERIQDALDTPGYLVGIYGSVARGKLGNDLDLVVWAPDGRPVEPIRVIKAFEVAGFSEGDTPYGGGPEIYFRLRSGWGEIHVRILRLEHAAPDESQVPILIARGSQIPTKS